MWTGNRYFKSFVVLLFLLLIAVIVNLSAGSTSISFSKIISVILGDKTDVMAYKIIWNIRLPRLMSALILGGALALSGFLLQTFFANPIAGPYILGISSGAKLCVALCLIAVSGFGLSINPFYMVAAAFLGAMLSMFIVLLLSVKVNNMSSLIVCGILIGYICSAITDFCVTFADDANIVNLHNWALGSFSGANWYNVRVMSSVVFICVFIAIYMSKPIGAFLLGESYAKNLGVNIKLLRVILIVLSSLLSSCVTAFAGPISFVGIAVPHLVKMMVNTSKPIVLIPLCFLGGSTITVLCDCVARTLFAPMEVSISSVTAVILVPVVIYMMVKRSD